MAEAAMRRGLGGITGAVARCPRPTGASPWLQGAAWGAATGALEAMRMWGGVPPHMVVAVRAAAP
jgi:hypothetical protein